VKLVSSEQDTRCEKINSFELSIALADVHCVAACRPNVAGQLLLPQVHDQSGSFWQKPHNHHTLAMPARGMLLRLARRHVVG
jgi:hypothetical protein